MVSGNEFDLLSWTRPRVRSGACLARSGDAATLCDVATGIDDLRGRIDICRR